MRKKENLLFNPVRVKQNNKLKSILMGLVAFLVVFAIIGVIYIAKNGTDSTNKFIKKIGLFFEPSNSSENKELLPDYTGKTSNILLMSVSSSKTEETGMREIYFLVIAHADVQSGQIKLLPVMPKPEYIVKYEEGGESAIVNAVSTDYGIKFDKYISSDENTFPLAINYMGGVEYNVSDRIEFRNQDMTLILTPGKQTLKGEVLIKYLKYLKETDLKKQGEMFCTIMDNFLTEENYKDAMKKYAGVLDSLSGNSNISYIDAADNLKYIEPFIKNSGDKAVVVNSVKEMK